MITVPLILAAGFGTRMKSAKPKVVHEILGKPMIAWAVDIVAAISTQKPVVVVGYGREQVEAYLTDRVRYAYQEEQLGTGHAVLQASTLLRGSCEAVLVTYGDMPLLQVDTVNALIDFYGARRSAEGAVIGMLTVVRNDPQGFGRVIRDSDGQISAIVEEVDCTPAQYEISELNPGVYCFDANWLWDNLAKVAPSAKGEYYLTDMVALAVKQGKGVVSISTPAEDVYGVNTRVHLAEATAIARARILERHMLNGVTIIDLTNTWIDETVQIGRDTILCPGTILQGDSVIGEACTLGPNSTIVNSRIGDCCQVVYSVVERARIEQYCEIGPFSHLRAGAHLAEGVHMGNFGEVKNSYLGPGVKMGHVGYLGDAEIGRNVNIGAGTITCNYDGQTKHKTVIQDGAFIGSDTMLIAPVQVGVGAKTGAGSVVTHDVEDNQVVYGVPASAEIAAYPPTSTDKCRSAYDCLPIPSQISGTSFDSIEKAGNMRRAIYAQLYSQSSSADTQWSPAQMGARFLCRFHSGSLTLFTAVVFTPD